MSQLNLDLLTRGRFRTNKVILGDPIFRNFNDAWVTRGRFSLFEAVLFIPFEEIPIPGIDREITLDGEICREVALNGKITLAFNLDGFIQKDWAINGRITVQEQVDGLIKVAQTIHGQLTIQKDTDGMITLTDESYGKISESASVDGDVEIDTGIHGRITEEHTL